VTITSLRAIKPPPPTPWIERPTSICVKSLATEQITVPTKKSVRAVSTSGRRPKMPDSEAKLGWKTVEERRNEVPLQKASIAVPLRSRVMIYPC
jgi:hypothetical protein